MHDDLPEDDDDKYWIRIKASNGELDLHNSIIDPKTSLKNFEKEAKTKPGVALKDHHGYKSFGYGRSANAMLNEDNELMIDFFILKNMEYTDYSLQFKSSEQLIRAIEHELVNQASIGFFGAREICNLCKLPVRRYSYWDWDEPKEERCSHKMGKEYDVGDGKMETATYTVYDGHLKEVSLVEFGSNRQTAIEKKREMRSFMEELLMTDQEWIAKLRDALEIPDIRSTDEPDTVVQTLETEVTGLRSRRSKSRKTRSLTCRQMPRTARRTAKRALMRQSSRVTVPMVTTSTRNITASTTDLCRWRNLRNTSLITRKRGMRRYRRADRRQIRTNRRQKERRSVCVNANGGCVSR